MLRGLRGLLGRRASPFTELERQLLAAIRGELEGQAGDLLDRQLQLVARVQRFRAWGEANAYFRTGRSRLGGELAFPNRSRELRLAKISFEGQDEAARASALLTAVNGLYFSMSFAPPAAIGWRAPISVARVEILNDPMLPFSPPSWRATPPVLAGIMREWHEAFGLRDMRGPLARQDHDRLLRQLRVPLPADYLQLTSASDGFSVGGWSVFGLSDAYGIVLEHGSYLVLAELPGEGVVGVAEEAARPEVYFLPLDGGARVPTASLTSLIDKTLRSGLKESER